MDKACFEKIEAHMLAMMQDSAHDRQHVYRVLYAALLIAQEEGKAAPMDSDVLATACLLHDIGRQRQYEDPSLCHAREGAQMAGAFLAQLRWPAEKVAHVQACIASHRYRKGSPPQSLEAKILYDADKLDAAGALGIARTLLYQGHEDEPLYTMAATGQVLDGTEEKPPSFFHEYCFKLQRVYDKMLTDTGRAMAAQRRDTAEQFYRAMLAEAVGLHARGGAVLAGLLEKQTRESSDIMQYIREF